MAVIDAEEQGLAYEMESRNIPLVSICVPAYNNAEYIAETIQSVLDQTYSNFEILISDDKSTDNTVEIIRSFRDERIKLQVNEKNLGMQGNWNKALSMASGTYTKLLCGDDILLPECLRKQVEELDKPENQDVSLIACRRKLIKSDGSELKGAFFKFSPGKYTASKVLKFCIMTGSNLVGEPMSTMFRTEQWKKDGMQLELNNYIIDLDMYAKILRKGSFMMMPQVLAAFRVHPVSMSGTLKIKQYRLFNEFSDLASFKKQFGVNVLHRAIGRFVGMGVTLARNVVLMLSK